MEVFTSVTSLKSFLSKASASKKSIGLVPTMGALHQGHISLIKESLLQNDVTICSIFVNPVQFNNPEDLAKYPRTLEEDYRMLENAGCHAVFAPEVLEMYPEPPVITLQFGSLESVMEGASRPGHFNGVGIVVAKLFNMVQPGKAYFGQKDFQQVAVVRRLIKDLSIPVELVVCPTLREDDGLAMSSRNRRLSSRERTIAPFIYEALRTSQQRLLAGEEVAEVKRSASDTFAAIPDFKLDYLEIVDGATLQPVHVIEGAGSIAICIAAFLGAVRLIDNIVF